MASDVDAPERGLGYDDRSRPWWLSAKMRLAILTTILLALGGYAVAGSGAGAEAGGSGWCRTPSGAPSQMLSLESLRTLAGAGGLTALARGRTALTQGYQGPGAAWSDAPSIATDLTPIGAGYEFAWRAPHGQRQLLDLFSFPTAADASYYAEQAGGTGCRLSATSRAVTSPPDARVVTWLNQRGQWQSDVFFSRGRVAYRVSVLTQTAATVSTAPGAAAPRGLSAAPLACRLTHAAC